MNIYFWPFIGGGGGLGYEPGLGATESLGRYLLFYLTTSFVWDLARAIGNGVLLALLGQPIVRALTRFRRKFDFQVLGA
jgi:energy-coupling factor transport system substrate-specific component